MHNVVTLSHRLERDRDTMKRQAEMAGEFSKQLLASGDAEKKKTAKDGVVPESSMDKENESKTKENE